MTQAIDKVYPEDCQDEDRRQIRKEVEEYVTRKGACSRQVGVARCCSLPDHDQAAKRT